MNYTIKIKKHLWWYWILLALIIIAIFLFLRQCKSPTTVLPPEAGKIVPIDTSKIIPDPDSVRAIVSDRLNIALTGDNKNITEFSKRFKELYPDEIYQIIYYDTVVVRLQIRIPANEREKIKNDLKTQMPEFDMLIWYEGIFHSELKPPDPDFANVKKQWYHQEIKVYSAWDKTLGDTSVIVAIIDDSFDLNHQEFEGKIYKPWNIPVASSNVNTGKSGIHGTHVAGIALANANNGFGVAGIAPNCKFMPIQVGDYNGIMSTTSVIDGILYAIAKGATVVNMSLGMHVEPAVKKLSIKEQEQLSVSLYKDEQLFYEELFKKAYNKNITFVLAAGNDDVVTGIDPMVRNEYTIKVSAIAPDESKANFSNFGRISTISAPGVKIYSSVPNNKFAFMQGTSMAAPIVTGGIALIKSVNPALSFDQIVDLIQSTGIPVNSPGKYIGNIIQLGRAVGIADTNRHSMPRVDCPDKQRKIDSLLQEIEKIKRSCPDTNVLADTMKIPDEPKNFDFAVGKWKSTTYIYSTSGERVTIFFDFFANGKGKITLLEEDNTQCVADLKLTINSGKFSINQTGDALCIPPPDAYNAYSFVCKQDNTGSAECIAQNKTNKSNKFKFKLIKIK